MGSFVLGAFLGRIFRLLLSPLSVWRMVVSLVLCWLCLITAAAGIRSVGQEECDEPVQYITFLKTEMRCI